jgi:hypothetical protein
VLMAAQLAPGLIEPDPESAHRVTLEYETPQLPGAGGKPLSHPASS